jgi:hypothetical protein
VSASSQPTQSQPAQSQSAPSRPTSAQPVQAADKRDSARANIIDDDEHTEGIRIVPGRDN